MEVFLNLEWYTFARTSWYTFTCNLTGMNMHKRTRLTPMDRKEIWRLYQTRGFRQQDLADRYRVSRQTVSKTIKRCRGQEFYPRDSCNHRYKHALYGIKRLAKVERALELKLKAQARRYNKSYPGEMLHVDTKRLPAIRARRHVNISLLGLTIFPGSCMQMFCQTKASLHQLLSCTGSKMSSFK